MSNRFASGKHAIAECDICGFQYKLKELRAVIIRTKPTNILACPVCWDKDHPQLQLGMYPVEDPQAVRNPRPDTSYYKPPTGSRQVEWGWNPVGGGYSLLTPNSLSVSVTVGTVSVVIS